MFKFITTCKLVFVFYILIFIYSCKKDENCRIVNSIPNCVIELFPKVESEILMKDIDGNLISFSISPYEIHDSIIEFNFDSECHKYQKIITNYKSSPSYEISFEYYTRNESNKIEFYFSDFTQSSTSKFVLNIDDQCLPSMETPSIKIIDYMWIEETQYQNVIRLENIYLMNNTTEDDSGKFQFMFLSQDLEIIRFESNIENWEIQN